IKSRGDASLIAYASNGHVKEVNSKGQKKAFDQASNIANVSSRIIVNGSINAKGNLSVKATSDNINTLKSENFVSLGLELMGTAFAKFPLNIDANVLYSKTFSNVEVKKGAKLEADGTLSVAAITNSKQKSGAKTASRVSNETAISDMNWLPIVAVAVNISEANASVTFDGSAKSNLQSEKVPEGEEPKKSISIVAESTSVLSASSKAKTSSSRAGAGIAFALGKHENKSTLNIGKNASFDAKYTIELASNVESENSVSSKSFLGRTTYAEPSIALAFFDSEANANVESNIDVKNQVGSFSINVSNSIESDELTSNSGITGDGRAWQEPVGKVKSMVMNDIYEKLHLANHIAGALPKSNAAKFGIAGAVAYGSGKHTANLNIKPGSIIKTTGELNLSSEMSVMDTKYSSTSDILCTAKQAGSSFETSIAFLYNDYDYSSNIFIDDSTNPKTTISGKEVSIESTVYQPYRRPEVLVEDLKDAWEKVTDYFSSKIHMIKLKKSAKVLISFLLLLKTR
ncbi:MAG: hypothetical protein IKO19_13035, partial [Candidatus Riflebacteria bacterium]|nr:hypothetical protein [Candidatus Riflebacteria bacterium]